MAFLGKNLENSEPLKHRKDLQCLLKQFLVVSGLPYAGKSYLLKHLLKQKEIAGAVELSLDKVRLKLFGTRPDHHITKTEHLFKNDCLRNGILEYLISGSRIVVSEATMLTREMHQKPIVEMVSKAEQLIQTIEREYCLRDNLPVPASPAIVQLKVVLCYASLKCVANRISSSQQERKCTGASVFDWIGMANGYSHFEFPDPLLSYEPLYLDTSDESDEANQSRIREVLAFIHNGFDLKKVNSRRKESAMEYRSLIQGRIRQGL